MGKDGKNVGKNNIVQYIFIYLFIIISVSDFI